MDTCNFGVGYGGCGNSLGFIEMLMKKSQSNAKKNPFVIQPSETRFHLKIFERCWVQPEKRLSSALHNNDS